MRNRLSTTPLALLSLLFVAFPFAALADLNFTVTLAANTALNLDTNTTSASGGDILWSGSTITPQTNATAYNIGPLGASYVSTLTQSGLSQLIPAQLYSKSVIPASSLTVNDVFAVHTNASDYSAVLVTAVSGTSITLQVVTFGVNSGPNITGVRNNYGGIPPGFSNSGIAQGALFYITGSGFTAASAQAVLQNSVGATLPTTLNGASVKVTVNGTTVTPVFYYAESIALGLVLPSNTPIGTGQVTVSYNNQTSPPYQIQVVASAMGFLTYNQQGTGAAIGVTFPSGALSSFTNSVAPGSTVLFYGSGLGADPKPSRDTTYVSITSAAADSINALTHIYVGGVDIGPPAYQGASGFPGLNQLNITLPANVPTGCNVSLVGITAAGVPTNTVTLPIGNGACSDPAFGTTGTQLQSLTGQANVNSGTVGLFQSTSPATSGTGTTTTAIAIADFQGYTGSAYGYSSSGEVSIGGCVVNQYVSSSSASTSTSKGLDAGTITLTGPAPAAAVTLSAFPTIVGESYALLAAGYIPTTGGTFTFKGAGGANVGPFTANVTFPNPVLTWNNQSAAATVTRSAGLLVQWSGGASGTYVIISGSSSATSSGAYASFTCIAPVSAGQFTVPAYILGALPPGTGSTSVENATNFQTFTASGLDFGTTYGAVSSEVNSTYN